MRVERNLSVFFSGVKFLTNIITLSRLNENLTLNSSDNSNCPVVVKELPSKKVCYMIKVETMEEERIVFNIINDYIPKQVKEILYNAIEEFEEERSI